MQSRRELMTTLAGAVGAALLLRSRRVKVMELHTPPKWTVPSGWDWVKETPGRTVYVSLYGDDVNADGSEARPFGSVGAAVNECGPGGTVLLTRGGVDLDSVPHRRKRQCPVHITDRLLVC